MSKLIALSIAALSLSVVAGCGGDGGTDKGIPTGDVSKRDYIAEADAICAEGDKEIDAAIRDIRADLDPGEQPSDEQVEGLVNDVIVPTITDELGQLRELEAPANDVDQISEIYDTAEENLGALEDDPGSIVAGRGGGPFDEANELAQAYGLKECGS